MASSTSGGSSGGSGGGYRPPSSSGSGGGQPPRGGSSGSGGTQPPYGGPPRQGRPGGPPPGQERIVSYQREDERYWTDYLRVALPIVGLLLLVGLLWFWLATIIGDDDDEEPTPTPSVGVTVEAPTFTATVEAVVPITPATQPAGPTNTPGGEQPTNTPEEGGGAATEEPAAEGRFQVDDTVVTNDPDVRLRSEPSSSSDETIITSYPETGTELTITGPSEEGDDGLTWWPVVDTDGNEGYVADDFIDAS